MKWGEPLLASLLAGCGSTAAKTHARPLGLTPRRTRRCTSYVVEGRRPASWTFAVLTLVGLAGGCMSARERHHFKAFGASGDGINYFRVDVSARACLSSSRYLSGYFDESAVDAYFGTFKQPADGAFTLPATGASHAGAVDAKAGVAEDGAELQPLDPCLAGKKLVMLLSSNSDEIANQISAFADGKEASHLLARLVNAREGADARAAKNALEILRREGELVAAAGDSLLAEPDAEADLLAFANRVARALGSARTFATLVAAQDWLAEQQRDLARH